MNQSLNPNTNFSSTRSSWGRSFVLIVLLLNCGCHSASFDRDHRNSAELPLSAWYSTTLQSVPDLNAISVNSDKDVWAIGDGGYLLHLPAGSQEWEESAQGGVELLSITSTSRKTLLVVGRDGSINRSVDGKNWQRVRVQTSSDLFVTYSAGSTAWAGGNAGTLLRSDDDGITWKCVPLNTDKRIRSIFASRENIFIVGESGQVFVGNASGTNWQKGSSGTSEELNGVYSSENGDLVLAVGNHGLLLRSIDHGVHWTPINVGVHVDLTALTGNRDASDILVIGGDGIFLRSSTRGVHWNRLSVPQNRTLRGIALTSDGTYYIAGLRGVVVSGPPEGLPQVLHGVPLRVEGVLQTKRFGLVAYGQGGTILISHDLGLNWQKQMLTTDGAITSAVESGPKLWVAGEHGTIAGTEDGIHWSYVQNLPDIRLNGIAVSTDGRVVFAVGKNGVVISSIDMGQNWSSAVPSSATDLNAVCIRRQAVFAAGNRGLLLKADLRTNTWKDLSADATDNFKAIVANQDGTSLWAFGTNGSVYYTHDAGSSWNNDDNSISDDLLAATCFHDCRQVVAVGQNGTVVYHQGSDENWSYLGKTRFDLRSITPLPDGTVLAVGSDLLLFHPKTITGRWQHDEFGDANAGYATDDGKTIWVVSDGGNVSHSVDSGVRWETTNPGKSASLLSIAGDVSGLRLWVAGKSGALASTRDGGAHWNIRKISENTLNCVRKIGDTLWVTGEHGTILRSNSHQDLWETLKSPRIENLWAISGDDSGRELWIVGGRGTILHSADAGATWTPQTSGTNLDLTAVLARIENDRKVVALGDAGTILVSHDGGEHWGVTNLGGSKLIDIVQSEKSKQILVVGEKGRLLLSDDEAESWYPGTSGTTNDFSAIVPVAGGEKFYAFGSKGSFVKYSMGSLRFEVEGIHMDHVLANVHSHARLRGLKTNPLPEFKIRALRSSELDLATPVELPTHVTPPGPGEDEWTSSFDLSELSPHAGESFNLQLCLNQGSFSRCFLLPRLTVVPVIDFNKNKKWIVPAGAVVLAIMLLTLLLYTKPLLILALYRRVFIYDLLEKSPLPGGGFIKVLLAGTLVPMFAFHRRTLAAWVAAHRDAFEKRWSRDSLQPSSSASPLYVPLPVEVGDSSGSQLVTAPSLQSLGRFLSDGKAVEILGPGGIGKTTLLRQYARWLFDSSKIEDPRLRSSLPLAVDLQSGSLRDLVKRKIENIAEEEISAELLKHLISSFSLVLFVDGFSELTPDVQHKLIEGLEELSIKGLVLSSRRQIDIPSLEHVRLFPKPLDSRTLLYFITALLARLPEDKAKLNTMQLQLDLGNRIVRAMASEGQETPLTPLLVTLYVDRAVDLLSQNHTLDDLPSTVAEAYFDFLRQLFRDTAQIGADRMLAAVKAIAKLSLGERFVPSKFSSDSVLRAIEPIVGTTADAALKSLVDSGILIQEQLGLGQSLHFVFDPLAEFCAAYAYAEDLGRDRTRWATFLEDLDRANSPASGFRAALALIVKTYGAKGLCLVDLPIQRAPLPVQVS